MFNASFATNFASGSNACILKFIILCVALVLLGPNTVFPSVVLDYDDDVWDADGNISLRCYVSDDVQIRNVSLYTNYTGFWALNQTNSSGLNDQTYYFPLYNLHDGRFTWNCYVCDTSSNCLFAASNRSVTVDSTGWDLVVDDIIPRWHDFAYSNRNETWGWTNGGYTYGGYVLGWVTLGYIHAYYASHNQMYYDEAIHGCDSILYAQGRNQPNASADIWQYVVNVPVWDNRNANAWNDMIPDLDSTGKPMWALAECYLMSGDSTYLDAAEKAASVMGNGSLFPYETYGFYSNGYSNEMFNWTTGICSGTGREILFKPNEQDALSGDHVNMTATITIPKKMQPQGVSPVNFYLYFQGSSSVYDKSADKTSGLVTFNIILQNGSTKNSVYSSDFNNALFGNSHVLFGTGSSKSNNNGTKINLSGYLVAGNTYNLTLQMMIDKNVLAGDIHENTRLTIKNIGIDAGNSSYGGFIHNIFGDGKSHPGEGILGWGLILPEKWVGSEEYAGSGTGLIGKLTCSGSTGNYESWIVEGLASLYKATGNEHYLNMSTIARNHILELTEDNVTSSSTLAADGYMRYSASGLNENKGRENYMPWSWNGIVWYNSMLGRFDNISPSERPNLEYHYNFFLDYINDRGYYGTTKYYDGFATQSWASNAIWIDTRCGYYEMDMDYISTTSPNDDGLHAITNWWHDWAESSDGDWNRRGLLARCANVADLMILDNRSISRLVVGHTATFNVTVRNGGRKNADGVTVRLSINGIPIQDLNADVPAGREVMYSFSTPITTAGDKIIKFEVDPTKSIKETQRGNNLAWAKMYAYPLVPDLTLDSSDIFFLSSVWNGSYINLTARVWNVGEVGAGSFSVSFFDGDSLIGVVPVSSLDVGDNVYANKIWAASPGGPHTINVVADSDSQIEEVDENNNQAEKFLYVSYLPDLSLNVTDISFSDNSPTEGGNITLYADINNDGGNVSTATVRFYDGYPDTTNLIGSRTLTVARNSEERTNYSWIATPPYTHGIYVTIDPENQVNESREDNNLAYRTIYVYTRPDLYANASDLTVTPESPSTGQQATLSLTVRNSGEAASGTFTVQFLDGSSLIAQKTSSVSGQGTASVTTTWTPQTNGSRVIKAVLDYYDFVNESNEANNEVNRTVTVSQASTTTSTTSSTTSSSTTSASSTSPPVVSTTTVPVVSTTTVPVVTTTVPVVSTTSPPVVSTTSTTTSSSTSTTIGWLPVQVYGGGRGEDPGELYEPVAVEADSEGNVYVLERFNERLTKFLAEGSLDAVYGSSGSEEAGELDRPYGLSLREGTDLVQVLVADTFNHRIQALNITSTGSAWSSFGEKCTEDCLPLRYVYFDEPADVETDDAGRIYVADPGAGSVSIFTAPDYGFPEPVDRSDIYGSEAFEEPWALAAWNGNMYIADSARDRIEIYSLDGSRLTSFGSSGSGRGEFNDPAGIAVDGSGNIYVADSGNGRVSVYDGEGMYLTEFGSVNCSVKIYQDPANKGLAQFCSPRGLKIKEGILYVADTLNHRVQAFQLPDELPDASCNLLGDEQPCDEITLSEVVNYINRWAEGEAALYNVVALINAWAA